MTSRRKPRALMTVGELIQQRGADTQRNALERDERARQAAGLRPHSTNPADPYAATEMRRCEPGCTQHPSTSPEAS